ncbi:MAG: DMT family transporter [Deltaproteobacteria bacterium]|nr:DMT family transporter [Deltaproteobacteria bacterium]
MPRSRVILTLLAVQALFGTLPLTGQLAMHGVLGGPVEGVRGLPPLSVAALRALGAALILGCVAGRRLWRVPARELGWLALFAVLGVIGNQALFLEGLSRTTQINAAVLIATIPVFTTGFALALRKERASVLRLLGIAVGLGGALLLAGIERFDLSDRRLVGNLLILANAALWSLHLVLARPVLQRLDPLVVLAWMFLFGALALVPAGAGPLFEAWPAIPAVSWQAMIWIVALPTVLAYLLNIHALRATESSQVAIFTYLQPLVAGALAWGWAGERPTLRTGAAALLIFAGVALVQVGGTSRRPAESPRRGPR